MLVINNDTKIHMIDAFSWTETKDADGVVKKVRFLEAELLLLPKLNEVPDKHWELAKAEKQVQKLLEEEILVERDSADISKMSAKEATKTVKDCADRALLEKWQGTEKRPPVRASIDAQIKAVSSGPSEAKAKESEEE